MTKALPFTQAGLTRAIRAARAAGMRVTAICPDGTVLVDDSSGGTLASTDVGAQSGAPLPAPDAAEWGEVEA